MLYVPYTCAGGGIANFTDVAATFKGINRALTLFAPTLIQQHIKIYIRRGGPNYQEALELMRKLAATLQLPIEVYGPETHMTAIVSLALGKPMNHAAPQLVPQLPSSAGGAGPKRMLSIGSPSGSGSGRTSPALPYVAVRPPFGFVWGGLVVCELR